MPQEQEAEQEITVEQAVAALDTWVGLTGYWWAVMEVVNSIHYCTGEFPHDWEDFKQMVGRQIATGDFIDG